jgi:hypothetical protein
MPNLKLTLFLLFFAVNWPFFVNAANQPNQSQIDFDQKKFEALKKQYPIDWFYKKYGYYDVDYCCDNTPGCEDNKEDYLKKTGNKLWCKPIPQKIIDQFTSSQIKSLLIAGKDANAEQIIKYLEPKISYNSDLGGDKFKEIRSFIYQQPFLKYSQIGCTVIRSLPKEFPNYSEIIVKEIASQDYPYYVTEIYNCMNPEMKKNRKLIIELLGKMDYGREIITEITKNFSDDEYIILLAITKIIYGDINSFDYRDENKFKIDIIRHLNAFPSTDNFKNVNQYISPFISPDLKQKLSHKLKFINPDNNPNK